jgi:hypothetical protein
MNGKALILLFADEPVSPLSVKLSRVKKFDMPVILYYKPLSARKG